ncbi:MAG: TIM44-like domain-containing protein [Ruminococcus sp.]|nr:TIM44-like domain-containing protein [Ruminococcus sp.]
MLALNSMFNPFIIIFILILAIPFVALTMFFLSKISGIGDIMSESNNLVQRENSTQKFLVYDPSFNEREFIIYVSNLYAEYRSCQDNKDVSTLRTKLTEALFSQLEMQTEELRRSGLTTHTEQMTLVNSWILCWKHENERDILPVRLDIELCEYTTNDATGEVVSGDRNTRHLIAPVLELARTADIQSVEFVDKELIICPKCGGEVEVEQHGKCPYCGNLIRSSKFDWVLSSISSGR